MQFSTFALVSALVGFVAAAPTPQGSIPFTLSPSGSGWLSLGPSTISFDPAKPGYGTFHFPDGSSFDFPTGGSVVWHPSGSSTSFEPSKSS